MTKGTRMRTLVLHIGFGKTGTTAIQLFLQKQKDWLLERGLIPLLQTQDAPAVDMHHVAVAFMRSRSKWNVRLKPLQDAHGHTDLEETRSLVETCYGSYLQEMTAGRQSGTWILSSEFFCAYDEADIAALKAFLAPYFDRIVVVPFVQNLYDVVTSHCSWSIINRGPLLHHLLEGHRLDFFDYPKVFERWGVNAETLEVSVKPVNYSQIKSQKENAITAFVMLLAEVSETDIAPDTVPLPKRRPNPTPNQQSVDFLYSIRSLPISQEDFLEVRRTLTKSLPSTPKWQASAELWEKFFAQAQSITEQTNAAYFSPETMLECKAL